MTFQLMEKRIKNNSIFSNCKREVFDRLAKGIVADFELNEMVPENLSSYLGIVISGRFEAYDKGNKKTTLNFFKEGDVFGAASVFLDNTSISCLRASKKSTALFISKDLLKEIFDIDSNVSIAYAEFLSQRVQFLSKKITAFIAPSVESTLCGYLLEVSKESESIKLNASLLSKTLDIGRTSLYRAISTLCDEKIITFENGVVNILDLEGLEKRI